jgi:hypothetical protein
MTDRLNADRLVILNCGLGRDSITMVCLLIEGRLEVEGRAIGIDDVDAVVFSDTGAEWKHTYDVRRRLSDLCQRVDLPFITLEKGDAEYQPKARAQNIFEIRERARSGAYHTRAPIMDDFASRSTVASLAKGDCTENNKILPIRRFMNDLAFVRFGVPHRSWGAAVRRGDRARHINIIGIAADETSRLSNGGKGPDYCTEAYPLVDMGIAKADEAVVLRRFMLNDVMKSGCYMCPYQPASWYWALSVQDPETFEAVRAYEARSLAANPRMNITGLKRSGVALRIDEVVRSWREKNPDATVEAVLSKEYSRCLADARSMRKAGIQSEISHPRLTVVAG